jgi:Topoisomerase DNA binding C4 zinc finger
VDGPCPAGSMLSAPRRTVNAVVLLLLLSGGLAAILVVLGVAWRLHRASQTFPSLGARNITTGDRCPECGDGTIRPAGGRFGQFLGCSTYPACRAAWRHGVRVRGYNYGRLG